MDTATRISSRMLQAAEAASRISPQVIEAMDAATRISPRIIEAMEAATRISPQMIAAMDAATRSSSQILQAAEAATRISRQVIDAMDAATRLSPQAIEAIARRMLEVTKISQVLIERIRHEAFLRGMSIDELIAAAPKATSIVDDAELLADLQEDLAWRLYDLYEIMTWDDVIRALPPSRRPAGSDATGISDLDFRPLFTGIFWCVVLHMPSDSDLN